ncbi:hypothetical protein [Pseudochelatococcus contaminans]|uniref:Uncharacterized protein n=1 Tax=Pseudochelatococcus contaminans TaxID=1538103 RepID=A0A7W6EHN7_9HYPH|nr:hypothetical protein [Pseudochelatococcus contaminans]MBB3810243.1 hypothetical protein [Pseudochelatococcus contaminans]
MAGTAQFAARIVLASKTLRPHLLTSLKTAPVNIFVATTSPNHTAFEALHPLYGLRSNDLFSGMTIGETVLGLR